MERLSRAALVCFALAACAAQAQEAFWYSQVDNDIVFETDRWYTSGLRLARAKRESPSRWTEWGIVQELYGADPKRSDFIDRPYAGRLLASAAWHDFAEGFHRTLEANLGVRGPAAFGSESQELIHRIVPGPQTDWSRQLPNRMDAALIAVHTHEFAARESGRERVAVHYGAVLGSQVTFAHAGVELRTGGPQAMEMPALRFAATPPIAKGGERGWSGFAGVGVRAILRNALLEGNHNPFGPPLARKDFVFRSAIGIAWSAPFGAITFGLTQDTREFETQRRNHRFGALGIRLDHP